MAFGTTHLRRLGRSFVLGVLVTAGLGAGAHARPFGEFAPPAAFVPVHEYGYGDRGYGRRDWGHHHHHHHHHHHRHHGHYEHRRDWHGHGGWDHDRGYGRRDRGHHHGHYDGGHRGYYRY